MAGLEDWEQKQIAEDTALLLRMFSVNPYPSYEISNELIAKNSALGEDIINILSEWGTPNHAWFADLRGKGLFDKDKVRTIGQRVVNRGDFHTL